ncbi:squalene synthase HpnC [Pelagibius litoralis]|uniref:Squalene synthase HpnC n=1 Tax=Pelagibius litoralis TaxID=374515 RepID=A0A967EYM1_9PROT|nr:squalene synthase HpnC [Pelagibius litoralis]NIA69835.1 squalene synthase HpnC [Pelagibius litoralis]
MTLASVETPSGKGAGNENFPVGSWLLPAALRPHVATYYAFARAIDDIADNPQLGPQEKLDRLTRFDEALRFNGEHQPGLEKAEALRYSLTETGVSTQRGSDLVAAFKQDAVKSRYEDWDELLGYCRLSANPVGQYLLDLHGESREGYRSSDALCTALQVLNHLQDCQDDYHALDRVYLPLDWLGAEGLDVTVLDSSTSPPGLRRVLDLCLDRVDDLLVEARRLPAQLRSSRLAMESAVIVRLATRLSRYLRRGDPLAGRVGLGKADFILAGFGGIVGVQAQRLFNTPQTAGRAG